MPVWDLGALRASNLTMCIEDYLAQLAQSKPLNLSGLYTEAAPIPKVVVLDYVGFMVAHDTPARSLTLTGAASADSLRATLSELSSGCMEASRPDTQREIPLDAAGRSPLALWLVDVRLCE